jgi:hypothetical protein
MAKGKSILYHCPHCDRMSKMELIGAVENQPEKCWYRCTRCRHATRVDLEALRQSQQEAKKKVDRSTATEYKPVNTYKIGDAIFHSEWDDVGKIVSKEKTSDGAKAIVVSFEKLGERRLLESVPEDPEPGQETPQVQQ